MVLELGPGCVDPARQTRSKCKRGGRKLRRGCAVVLSLVSVVAGTAATADEGGVSFWLPGQYGSFAAVAPEPGWSLPLLSYYYSGDASAEQAIDTGGAVRLGVDTDFVGQFVIPTYTPDAEFLGGRPSFSLGFLAAKNDVSANLTLGSASGAASDSVSGIGDLYPTAQVFWNRGVHNWMAYATGAIPVGDYDPNRLSNIGIGHGAIDLGGAYTFLNPDTGWEFSATVGLTYNFKNSDTGYQNGVDAHLDVGVSRFLSERLHIGLVGFAYQQLTADSGQPVVLGDFKSSTFGVGPQIGYTFDVGGREIFTNLRGYWEFDSSNRTQGGSVMLTVNVPLG